MALIECWECGNEISSTAPRCPHCGAAQKREDEEAATEKPSVEFSMPVIAGLVGTGIMALGVFLPFLKAPIIGSINAFKNGQGDGIFILGIAVVAGLSFLARKYLLAVLAGISAGAIITLDTVDAMDRIAQAKGMVDVQLADNPFRDLAAGMMESIQLEWGVFVLYAGVALIFIAALWGNALALKEKKAKAVVY